MKMKRFLSIALALCMMLSLLPANVLAVEWPEAATRVQMPQRGADAPQLVDGYYEIYTADQLYWFAEQVNSGNTSINGKLMADIVVNENVLNADGTLNGDGCNFRVWTTTRNIHINYSGTFDGNDKIVSGLYFNDSSRSYVGLFGCVDFGGVVQSQVLNGTVVEYAFNIAEIGEYSLRISKANHATREYIIFVGPSGDTMDVTIYPIGDVTGDGNANIKDFQRLLRHVNKTNPLTDYELTCGDVTGDGVCNIKDFQRLLRHVNKTNPLF